jgi:hypothetical protein
MARPRSECPRYWTIKYGIAIPLSDPLAPPRIDLMPNPNQAPPSDPAPPSAGGGIRLEGCENFLFDECGFEGGSGIIARDTKGLSVRRTYFR